MGEGVLLAAIALVTGLLTCAATGAIIPVLRRQNILDHPNERSSHSMPTPRGGGIALIGALLLAWLALAQMGAVAPRIVGISLAAAALAVVCWIDDLRGLSPWLRLLAQGAAVAVGISCLPETTVPLAGRLGSVYLTGLGLLWVWWLNLFNFMDGIDGLAGAEAAAIGVGMLLFATFGVGTDSELGLLAAAIVGAAMGFLVWNWSPARIFLGDVGSAPLGYLLGFLLLALALRGFWKIALILPLYFLADATITLTRRLLRGERVWQAHREHYYQQAVRQGLGHTSVVKRVIAADILLTACGWASENGWGAVSLGLSVVIVTGLLVTFSHSR
jgi:UDP-N-acetylmuramyl pentapeptide phosphotransferase/UDP-N-acetylglucosamine-1-phosphate transferase